MEFAENRATLSRNIARRIKWTSVACTYMFRALAHNVYWCMFVTIVVILVIDHDDTLVLKLTSSRELTEFNL